MILKHSMCLSRYSFIVVMWRQLMSYMTSNVIFNYGECQWRHALRIASSSTSFWSIWRELSRFMLIFLIWRQIRSSLTFKMTLTSSMSDYIGWYLILKDFMSAFPVCLIFYIPTSFDVTSCKTWFPKYGEYQYRQVVSINTPFSSTWRELSEYVFIFLT